MDFEQIENKIVDQLKASLTYVRTIETYAGQLETDIESLPIRFPAIYVMYSGSQLEWVDGQANYNEVDVFTVLAAAKNLKGNEAVRKDTEIGCYKMIKDVLAQIANKNFSLDIEKMRPTEIRLIYISSFVAIYGIEFQTNFDKVYS